MNTNDSVPSLFGADFDKGIPKRTNLKSKFIEPPFSVLDGRTKDWQLKKNRWKALGIKSEIGRDAKAININIGYRKKDDKEQDGYVSIFDGHLCEVMYKWFCPEGGDILDPFAGGSVRGIIANYLGYNYTGIDIRQEQIDSNREQALDILPVNNQPNWYVGDSNKLLSNFTKKFDFIFTCPPYADLEVYSDLEGDISNMEYPDFINSYKEIIKQSCNCLKNDCYACFVVGEVRDKRGNYLGFIPDTINAFRECGMSYYNEMILLTPVGTSSLRANGNMKTQKIAKVHQNVLVFKKNNY